MSRVNLFKSLNELKYAIDEEKGITSEPEVFGGARHRYGAGLMAMPSTYGYGGCMYGGAYLGGAKKYDNNCLEHCYRSNAVRSKRGQAWQETIRTWTAANPGRTLAEVSKEASAAYRLLNGFPAKKKKKSKRAPKPYYIIP